MKLKIKKTISYEFVVEELRDVDVLVRPMIGGYALYVGDKIVLIFRQKDTEIRDNGIWIATTHEHHSALKKDFPMMRSIFMFSEDGTPSGWQNIPEESPNFEEAALKLCRLIKTGDPRIGKIPKPRKKKIRADTVRKTKPSKARPRKR